MFKTDTARNMTEGPLLERMVKDDLYLFGTPDPTQFFVGAFYGADKWTVIIHKPLLIRVVQNSSQVGLSAMIPGDIIGIKPLFYSLNKIGITYAHPIPDKIKETYVKYTSGIIIPPAGVIPKPFGG